MPPEQSNGFPPDLLIGIDRSARRGLRAQLEAGLRGAIQEGRLATGTLLPPTRVLAGDLGVARSVVVEAYGQLAAEGYLSARQGSGTRVREVAHARSRPRRAARADPGPVVARFVSGVPDPATFPRRSWGRHYRAVLDSTPDPQFSYPDPQGARELRRALAGYLGRVRGVVADPSRLLVCAGFAQALAVTCRVLRARGVERLGIEDPCFGFHREMVLNAGLEAVPIPVDDDGLRVGELRFADVGAVFVSPAHSYPLGAVLSPARRVELVAWARERDAFVIEDDYDAEFRYDRTPVGALQGLAPERVLYGGSTSKTLSPLLRLGWLAAPAELIDELRREKFLDDMASGLFEQLALARFVESGDLARHLRRVRPLYRRRRDTLVAALARWLPEARPRGVAAGLHLYVELPEGVGEAALAHAARERGVHIEEASWHWADRRPPLPGAILGYASLSEGAIERGVEALGAAYAAL
jgi:GntR family transcriptional regulator/MocR family aminotransferase